MELRTGAGEKLALRKGSTLVIHYGDDIFILDGSGGVQIARPLYTASQ